MSQATLEAIVEAVNDMPALPHVVIKVMELTEDPNSTAQDINAVLNHDQGMTAKVLRMANSAFYGFPRRIATVTDATLFLGFKTVRSIVIAASVSDMLNKEMKGFALAPGELWRHSQCVAIACRYIAKMNRFASVDLAYTAGLLHDIGKVILNDSVKESYHEVVEMALTQNVPFMTAENDVLGFNHAVIGSKIAEKWNLPPDLVEAIACHHEPEQARVNKNITAIVHVADALCMAMGIGIGIDGMMYPFSEQALQILGLNEADLEAIISQLTDIFADQQSF